MCKVSYSASVYRYQEYGMLSFVATHVRCVNVKPRKFLTNLVRRGDVQAAWSGIRPLVTDPNSKDTQSISRNHVVEVSESGLVTIAGAFQFLKKYFCLPC